VALLSFQRMEPSVQWFVVTGETAGRHRRDRGQSSTVIRRVSHVAEPNDWIQDVVFRFRRSISRRRWQAFRLGVGMTLDQGTGQRKDAERQGASGRDSVFVLQGRSRFVAGTVRRQRSRNEVGCLIRQEIERRSMSLYCWSLSSSSKGIGS
jgi:hypothetical protein